MTVSVFVPYAAAETALMPCLARVAAEAGLGSCPRQRQVDDRGLQGSGRVEVTGRQ